MQRKEVLGLIDRFRACLATRDSNKYDVLFAKDTLKQVMECHNRLHKLRFGLLEEYDEFNQIVNREFAGILRKFGEEQAKTTRRGIHDDPDNLVETIKVLRQLSKISNGGFFRDPNLTIAALIDPIIGWLEARERALRPIMAIPLPHLA